MRTVMRGERLVALFFLAWFAFHPPILNLFAINATLFGWPVLYLYILSAWAAVIALVALIATREDETPTAERSGDGRPERES